MAIATFRRNDTGQYRVVVLLDSGIGFISQFIADEPEPDTWGGVTIRVEDRNGDGGDEAWIGYRHIGTGDYLDLDIIELRPETPDQQWALKELPKGIVKLAPGGASVFAAFFTDTDPGCCPSKFDLFGVAWTGIEWVKVNPDLVDAAGLDLPAGDF